MPTHFVPGVTLLTRLITLIYDLTHLSFEYSKRNYKNQLTDLRQYESVGMAMRIMKWEQQTRCLRTGSSGGM
jgi:hypothetical protein